MSQGKVRPYIAEISTPSKDEQEILLEQLLSQGFNREETQAIEEPKRKTKIRLHQKLDKKVAFKKPHLPGTMSAGPGSAVKEKADVVVTGGDGDDYDDYEEADIREEE